MFLSIRLDWSLETCGENFPCHHRMTVSNMYVKTSGSTWRIGTWKDYALGYVSKNLKSFYVQRTQGEVKDSVTSSLSLSRVDSRRQWKRVSDLTSWCWFLNLGVLSLIFGSVNRAYNLRVVSRPIDPLVQGPCTSWLMKYSHAAFHHSDHTFSHCLPVAKQEVEDWSVDSVCHPSPIK